MKRRLMVWWAKFIAPARPPKWPPAPGCASYGACGHCGGRGGGECVLYPPGHPASVA